jgi:hypothetical protein
MSSVLANSGTLAHEGNVFDIDSTSVKCPCCNLSLLDQ